VAQPTFSCFPSALIRRSGYIYSQTGGATNIFLFPSALIRRSVYIFTVKLVAQPTFANDS